MNGFDKQEIEREYACCVSTLKASGILTFFPKSEKFGVFGIDGKEYPIPTKEEVVELFAKNRELVNTKVLQGFNCLEITPLAMSTDDLIDLMKEAILRHAAERKIFQTKRSSSDVSLPIYVNSKKQVWIWDKLKQVLNTEELIYFPQEFFDNHQGQTKIEVINNKRICAFLGWSVGLVENLKFMPLQGQGKILGGRKQFEIGSSPSEYLQILQTNVYKGETGKTIEDFCIKFLNHLQLTNEISNDRLDNNSLWCLGQYVKIKYAACVPTGWWHRDFGRLRLDMHRTRNKLCTKSWGMASTVRLPA